MPWIRNDISHQNVLFQYHDFLVSSISEDHQITLPHILLSHPWMRQPAQLINHHPHKEIIVLLISQAYVPLDLVVVLLMMKLFHQILHPIQQRYLLRLSDFPSHSFTISPLLNQITSCSSTVKNNLC